MIQRVRKVRSRSSGSPRRQIAGYTIVEVLLVVALIGAFAAMTIPSVMRMFGQQKLTSSAERVREAITRARVQAIETGLTYQFLSEANGTHFAVVPAEADHSSSQQSGQSGRPIQGRMWGDLPKGIRFTSSVVRVTGNTSLLSGTHTISSSTFDGLPNSGGLSSVSWSMPILFRPDGSANADASVTIGDTKRQHINLHVRGFTGAVSMQHLVAETK